MFKIFSSWSIWAVFQSLMFLGVTFLFVAVIPVLLPDLVISDAVGLVVDTWFYVTVVIAIYAFVMAVRDRKKELEREC